MGPNERSYMTKLDRGTRSLFPNFILSFYLNIPNFTNDMCFFEQRRRACGFWRWERFVSRCHKEHRIGETCGLKLIWITHHTNSDCKLCLSISKKERRIRKMTSDITRWEREANKPATIETTKRQLKQLLEELQRLQYRHKSSAGTSSGGLLIDDHRSMMSLSPRSLALPAQHTHGLL
ncbi:hypothetical protein BJ170DRAFT_641277 [Xylariales sp. AK1849]|nr:hypothetical protein BJ170DRAFT_641277 [Xylariales sp. AK1849]